MKNKKGFSLVELLIVIAIIGVLAGIIIPSVTRYLKNSKKEYNDKLSTELITISKSYYSENKSDLPRGYLNNQGIPINKTLLGASYLVSNNYITGEFKDSEGNDCTNSSYIIVEKEGNDYKYTTCIVCDNGYTNSNDSCIYTAPGVNGDMKDNVLPRCNLTLSSGELNKWTNKDVVLNLNLEDNKSLAGYYLNGSSTINKISGTSSLAKITLNTSIKTENYYVLVEDSTANMGKCIFDGTIKIDKEVPAVSITATKKTSGSTVPTNTWSNEGLNFKFTKTKEGESGSTIYYCKDTNNTCDPNIKANNNELITSYNTTAGSYYIRYKIVSGAGTSSNVNSFTAKIDNTKPSAPTVVLVNGDWQERYNNTWYNYNIFVAGKANSSDPTPTSTDAESGIAKYQISTDKNTWQDWSYDYNSSVYRINWEGTTYRYVRAIDTAGNISDITTKTIKIDKVTPTVNITATKKSSGTIVSTGTLSNEGLNFKFTKTKEGESGSTIYYCKDTNNTCVPNIKANDNESITSYNTLTGEYYIRYKIISGAGASSSIESYQANVNKDVLPSKIVLYNYAYNNSYVYNSEVGQEIVVYIPELTDISHLTIKREFYGSTKTISPSDFTYQSSCDSASGLSSSCFKYTDTISDYAVKGYYATYSVCNSSSCKSASTLISLRGCLHITNSYGKNCWYDKDKMCSTTTTSGCSGNVFYSGSYDRYFIGQFASGSSVFNRLDDFHCYMWDGNIEKVADYRCDLHPDGTGQSYRGSGYY